MFSTLYDFCRDQGSIIGGLLALAAGYLVFRGTTRTADRQVAAANAQTEALRQQNRDLRNEGQRRQGRDGIVATKLLASVLGIIINDVDKLKPDLDSRAGFRHREWQKCWRLIKPGQKCGAKL